MLRDRPRTTVRAHLLLWRLRRAHDAVHARLLAHALAPPIGPRGRRRIGRRTTAVPDAAHLVARDDLRQPSGLDMSYLDEAGVKEQHVRWVPSDVLCRALPFNRLYGIVGASTVGIAMAVDVETELCL